MSYLPFALLAYLLNSIAILIDKFQLVKNIPNPLIYIFYISIFSLVALLLLPFTPAPTLTVFIFASISTLLWTTGAYFLYSALRLGQASRIVPIVGVLIPMALLGYYGIISHSILINQTWAVVILILAIILLNAKNIEENFNSEHGAKLNLKKEFVNLPHQELLFGFLSAAFFAASYIFLKQAYEMATFLTVLSWSRVILVPLAVFILLIPNFRKIVLQKKDKNINFFSKIGLLFLAGQSAGGASELLLTFSISLANPALVNSLQGVSYTFLFIFSLALTKNFPKVYQEDLSKFSLITKIIGILLIAFGLYILAQNQTINHPKLAITYSPKFASELKLDPQQTFLDSLDELQVKKLRLPVYWDDAEKTADQFDFSNLDFYLNEAEKRHVEVILVIGYRVPRWPECFSPTWANSLPPDQLQQRILKLVNEEVKYFKKFKVIKAWQVENEPGLSSYGICRTTTDSKLNLLKKELAIVKSQDTRPILVTASGELSNWLEEMRNSDKFGTTLYKLVWDKTIGYFNYPLPPFFYILKENLIRLLTQTQGKESLIAELQAEPWASDYKPLSQIDISLQQNLFPVKKIKENVDFAKETNFSSIYLWGVEWWYYMQVHGYPEYVKTAKTIFNNPLF